MCFKVFADIPVVTDFNMRELRTVPINCQENELFYPNPALFADGQMGHTNMSFLITNASAVGRLLFVELDIMIRIIIFHDN